MNLTFCILIFFIATEFSFANNRYDSTLLHIRAKRSPQRGGGPGGFGGGAGGFGGGPGGFGGGRGGGGFGFGGGRGIGGFGRGFGGRGLGGRPIFGGFGGGIFPFFFYRRRRPYLYGPFGSYY